MPDSGPLQQEDPAAPKIENPVVEGLDETQIELALEVLRQEQRLPLAVLGGLLASLAGAAIWAGITVATEYQIGWMAIGVGFLVGMVVRVAGRGLSNTYRWIGAGFALFGCALGNIFTLVYVIAQHENLGLLDTFTRLGVEGMWIALRETASPIDFLFYVLAIAQGYQLALRSITEEDISRAVEESGGAVPQATS